ncbi:MAG: DNA primase [Candidatus Doudnabacteria bacterium]
MNEVEEIKNRLNVADVIADYIQLTPVGANFKARCPFHSEKTPSFYVSPEKQIWHCFGCEAGGDIFTFVQKMEGLEFREALKILAEKAGVKLEARDPNLETERDRLVSLCEWAARFFHQALLRSREGKIARDYLVSRKVGEKMIQKFLLGYSPFSWHLTMDFLRKKGFSAAEIFAAGLASQKTPGRFYDRFRGRLTFPLRNIHGQAIGFGARVLNEERDHLGKYINSPQSLIYDKSGLLYALDQAKQMIKKENLCIAVEGYLDVISSHQVGVTNVVGVSGTALTPAQLILMKRYTHNLALCFDADMAGVGAAKRGIENAIAAGLAVRVIILPKDEDPDSLIRKNPELWREATKRAVGIMEFYFDLALKHYNPEELAGKKMIAAEVLPIIKKIPDQIEQAYYLQKLSSLINIREESLREAMARIDLTLQYSQSPDRNVVAPPEDFNPAPADIVGRHLLGLGLKYPRFLGEILEEAKPSILSSEWQDIYKVLSKYYNKNRSFDFIHFKRKIQTSHPQYVTRLEVAILDVEKDLEENDQKEDIIALEVQQALKRLKEQYYRQKLEAIELQMQRAEDIKDRVLSQSLTKQLQSFTQKLGKL